MILDDNLTFIKASETPVTTTKAIPLGQADLQGNTKGLSAYVDLILHVCTAEKVTGFTTTLETSDEETGTFEAVQEWTVDAKAGIDLVASRIPWNVRNWVRLTFSSAIPLNAHLALDVDKRPYPMA